MAVLDFLKKKKGSVDKAQKEVLDNTEPVETEAKIQQTAVPPIPNFVDPTTITEKKSGIFSKFSLSKKDQSQPLPVKPDVPISPEIANETKPEIMDPNKAIAEQGMTLLDVLAPRTIEIDFDFIKINDIFFRTLFISGYPRFVSPGWLEQIINFDSSLDISFYVYPIEAKGVLEDLRHKIAEMEAEIATDLERGRIVNASTQAKLDDARILQEELVKGAEHFYEFAFYITIPARSLDDLNDVTKQVQSTLGSVLVAAQTAVLDMENGFSSTLPFATDRLNITRNMDTTSLSTTFPLTSAELSSDSGVLYGINPLNDSFIIFDRYSMENSNMAIFATSGAGKTVEKNEPVLYQNSLGETKLDSIGNIVENVFKEKEVIKFDEESEGVVKPNIKVLSFNDSLKAKWSVVTVAARKKSPKTLYKITTKSGRAITTTKDHNFVALERGLIKVVRGDAIKTGSYLPLAKRVLYDSRSQKYISVEDTLQKVGADFLYVSNNRIKHPHHGTTKSIPRKINLNSGFFRLLGYFASEGMVIPKRALISSCTHEVLEDAHEFYSTMKINYSLVKKSGKLIGIYTSNHLFSKFLKVIGASGKANEKRIPEIVFSASKKHAAEFLKAYFEGDGGVEKHEISATTKSKGLASDLSYLLLRFGIITRTRTAKKAATNTKNKTKHTYYRLRISGQDNIREFINNISFISKEKNLKTKRLLKKGNTNVDVIPELQPIFKEIYDVLYSSSEIPAPKKFSEIKLGIFKPSSKNLLSIIEHVEERIKEIEDLERDGLLTLRNLPPVQEILKEGEDKTLNTLLWKNLGKSWWTIKNGCPPKLNTALRAAAVTHGYDYSASDVTGAIHRTFQKTGESLSCFNYSLWTALINANQNPLYESVINARDYISQKYQEKKAGLQRIKEKINFLKTLATSDLFWDPVVKIKKFESKDKYVYDLQVENEVFLAGHGGLFVHNSYFVKLESLRSLMLGTEIIIIDPEAEYKDLSEAVGGQYITFAYSSPSKINPFDLSQVYEEGENQLGLKILSLHSLFKVIMGTLSATQEALLDHALIETYRGKGITQDSASQTKEPPLMEDLYKTLVGMETDEAMDLAARIEKFVKGSFVGIFDQQTNVEINNPFTVFSVKEVQDALRPIAMFIILDFIWTKVKRDLKRRLLVVDEAWHMMRYADSAQFMWSIVKRARKYYLGLTTITQDVEDFLSIDIGKAIVTNSALRVLLKQSPAAIDKVGDVFYLSQGEKQLLLGANIGEGIFFAGNHHVPIYIVASPEEHKLITTRPQELLARQKDIPPAETVVEETKTHSAKKVYQRGGSHKKTKSQRKRVLKTILHRS